MADSPWMALRQAEQAVKQSRPEEAHRLIEPLIAEGYRKASRLAREVVKAYVTRAVKLLDQNNPGAAWSDLLAAESLNTGDKTVTQLRQTLARFGLVTATAALEAGNTLEVVAEVGRLRDRGVRHPDLSRLEAAAREWNLATELADRGEFLRAIDELDKLSAKLPCPPTGFDAYRAEIDTRHARFRTAVGRLYDAAEALQWRDALAAADEVLAVAPEHREAKAIRGKAWLAAAPAVNPGGSNPAGERLVANLATTRRESRPAPPPSTLDHAGRTQPPPLPSAPAAAAGALPKRFLLWIDGVGGYLVCLGTRVTFGQATAEAPVDVPLFADVSRLHAEITRDGEGYIFESGKSVLVNGQATTRSVLVAGDRVTLGATCQFLFHKPIAISSTARLELTSGHRLPVAVDGVLLMGNELILGSGPEAHIHLKGVPAAVQIYRSKDGLAVRVPEGRFRIDDRVCHDRATLPLPCVVSSDNFTFAVEAVTGRL